MSSEFMSAECLYMNPLFPQTFFLRERFFARALFFFCGPAFENSRTLDCVCLTQTRARFLGVLFSEAYKLS
jgi:hypothetical protein